MPRDFKALYRAQAQARTATVQNETVSLPPGYLVGYDVRLRQDYTVVITAGAANIGGRLVQITEDHQLADADWVAPKINSTRHYYIYLSAAGQWFVDIVAPVWNNQYLYYEQPDTNWRAVGKIFLADGQIIFGIKEVEKNEQTVTVSPEGFTGRADYYCTGENDQILINAAIRYLQASYSGGRITLLRGTFTISSRIEILGGQIEIYGENRDGVIIASSATLDYGIYAYYAGQITLQNIKFTTVTSSAPVYIRGTTGSKVLNCYVTGSGSAAIYLYSADKAQVSGCNIIQGGATAGIYILNTYYINISHNDISYGAGSNFEGRGIDSRANTGVISDNLIHNFTEITAIGTNAGIYIDGTGASFETVVANNVIVNNALFHGIYVASSLATSVKITGNYCYNNGSDTGIANTNLNNFYDAGTDTQVYSNSWQQPVAGEPTQGELKWCPQATNTTTYALFLGTTTAVWSSISLGTLVPVGTKSAYATIYIQASSAAAGIYNHRVAFSSDTTSTPAAGTPQVDVGIGERAAGAGELITGWYPMFVPVDSSRKTYYYAFLRTNASNCQMGFNLKGYTV